MPLFRKLRHPGFKICLCLLESFRKELRLFPAESGRIGESGEKVLKLCGLPEKALKIAGVQFGARGLFPFLRVFTEAGEIRECGLQSEEVAAAELILPLKRREMDTLLYETGELLQ